jgi:hypothetical protein
MRLPQEKVNPERANGIGFAAHSLVRPRNSRLPTESEILIAQSHRHIAESRRSIDLYAACTTNVNHQLQRSAQIIRECRATLRQ